MRTCRPEERSLLVYSLISGRCPLCRLSCCDAAADCTRLGCCDAAADCTRLSCCDAAADCTRLGCCDAAAGCTRLGCCDAAAGRTRLSCCDAAAPNRRPGELSLSDWPGRADSACQTGQDGRTRPVRLARTGGLGLSD